MKKLVKLISTIQECSNLERIQENFEKSAEGISKKEQEIKIHNEDVLKKAEIIYKHYLSEGKKIANQKKQQYIKLNIKGN